MISLHQTPAPSDCTTCSSECLQIVDFVVVDADKDLNIANPASDYLFSIGEGEAYSLSNIQQTFGATNLALLCVTNPPPFSTVPFTVGSVGLRDNVYRTHANTQVYDPVADYNVENSPPFALADHNAGDYNPTDFTLGLDWSITCQAFCGSDLQGGESPPVTRNFQIIDDINPSCNECSSECMQIVGEYMRQT